MSNKMMGAQRNLFFGTNILWVMGVLLLPKLEEAMKKYNKTFEYKIYPGAAHAFSNDTGARYNAEAAADAWKITLAFLQKYLKS